MSKSVYSDAQWRWLFDRNKEGYFQAELADFAGCSLTTMRYHWYRLGLKKDPNTIPPLDREEFESLRRVK